ncbi:hypothetical protein CEXT_757391 [Caerostris extrusa]|uniref:Uncharacterized protein n=1 Tax=Caerostris extrusa TaxID=172846 RepID=A0AAV4X9S3_CAEEX|nr:hypothetical protein CEXT_757391 [Caerostris extrusa]
MITSEAKITNTSNRYEKETKCVRIVSKSSANASLQQCLLKIIPPTVIYTPELLQNIPPAVRNGLFERFNSVIVPYLLPNLFIWKKFYQNCFKICHPSYEMDCSLVSAWWEASSFQS